MFSIFTKKIWKIENPSKKNFWPSRAPQNIFLFDNSQKEKYKTKCSLFLQKKSGNREPFKKNFFAPPEPSRGPSNIFLYDIPKRKIMFSTFIGHSND
jgi:hypothetical protein